MADQYVLLGIDFGVEEATTTYLGDCTTHGRTEYTNPDKSGNCYCKACVREGISKFLKEYPDQDELARLEHVLSGECVSMGTKE